MGNVLNYIKTVIRNLPDMVPAQREQEIANIEKMLDEAIAKYEESNMRRVAKLERENYRLRVLLDTAAEAIADLRENPY